MVDRVNGGLNGDDAESKVGLIVELGAGYVSPPLPYKEELMGSRSLAKTRYLLRSLAKVLRSKTGYTSIDYKAVRFPFLPLIGP